MPSPSSQNAQEVKNGVFLSSSHFYTSEILCFASLKRRILIFVRRAFVARRTLSEQTLEAEWKHHSSCLSCATKAQRMSVRKFLLPLLSLAPLFGLSYVFLGNFMLSLGFSLVHLFLQKRKRVDEIQKSLSHTYNSKFHQNIYLLIFTLFYVYSYLS